MWGGRAPGGMPSAWMTALRAQRTTSSRTCAARPQVRAWLTPGWRAADARLRAPAGKGPAAGGEQVHRAAEKGGSGGEARLHFAVDAAGDEVREQRMVHYERVACGSGEII